MFMDLILLYLEQSHTNQVCSTAHGAHDTPALRHDAAADLSDTDGNGSHGPEPDSVSLHDVLHGKPEPGAARSPGLAKDTPTGKHWSPSL